jgi:DNA-binding MarR family transcriptional regulator
MDVTKEHDWEPAGGSEENLPHALPSGFFLPEDSLPHAFSVVANRISLILQGLYVQRFGLSLAGWRILGILGTHQPLSAKALAELTAMDQVSISRAVDYLVSKKLVSRRTDTSDRRRVVLRLTKKGEEVYNTIVPVLYASENALVSSLSAEDEAALRRIMSTLLERSAKLLGPDTDWKALLQTYGYNAQVHLRENDATDTAE